MNKIKWGCIQPLTGGMYIGAQNAIGCPAEWIISFPGLSDVKCDKEGNIKSAGNEYNLLQWLKKRNINIPYYTFEHKMFENPDINDVRINTDLQPLSTAMFEDVDIVVAVPVCSGLSNITIASNDTKNTRNCNMEFIAKYVLNAIKPKIYIFENAPTLVSDKGKNVRTELENIANAANYSIMYVKTDTYLHNNCQKRPRTFVMFIQNDGSNMVPSVVWEDLKITANKYFEQIPENATQQTPMEMSDLNNILIKFMKYLHGDNWRTSMKNNYAIQDVYAKGPEGFDEFIDFVNTSDLSDISKSKIVDFLKKAKEHVEQGRNFYSTTVTVYKDYTPSIQFKSLQCLIHHNEDRLLTIREALHLMGMPLDFELYGGESDLPKIGQNVPVMTANWIVRNAVNYIYTWNTLYRENKSGAIFDNVKRNIEQPIY